jgi:hypothetical protein
MPPKSKVSKSDLVCVRSSVMILFPLIPRTVTVTPESGSTMLSPTLVVALAPRPNLKESRWGHNRL